MTSPSSGTGEATVDEAVEDHRRLELSALSSLYAFG
jgi:hypothetical protein